MTIIINRITVTAENLDEAREECRALDQREDLKPGCETWGIIYKGGQRGQMTVWPEEARAAVEWGGDSEWGYWSEASRTLCLDSGEIVTETGEVLVEDEA